MGQSEEICGICLMGLIRVFGQVLSIHKKNIESLEEFILYYVPELK